MKKCKKAFIIGPCGVMILSIAVITTNAATNKSEQTEATTGITVHYYCESGTPTI